MTKSEHVDTLQGVREAAAKAAERLATADAGVATASDLVVGLAAIAEELRTANLLAYASLAKNERQMYVQVEAAGRLGYAEPDPTPFGPFGHVVAP